MMGDDRIPGGAMANGKHEMTGTLTPLDRPAPAAGAAAATGRTPSVLGRMLALDDF